MADDEVVLTVRLPKPLYERLRHAARASDRSMAATLRVLVERGCPEHRLAEKVGRGVSGA